LETLEKYLVRFPWDPESNYRAGLIYLDREDNQKAAEYLVKASKVWENADPEYKLAQECLKTFRDIAS